jgi:membrane protein DedA with SNARE-associated domain
MLSGFLVRTSFLAFWPAYLLLIAGDLTGDVIWYAVGRHGARPLIDRFGRFLSLTDKDIGKAEQLFHKHQTKVLFLSKITMGFGFALATLVAAGAAHIPFKKYMTINLVGEFLWAGMLMGAGFFLGNLYTLVDKSLRFAFAIALVVIAAAAAYGCTRYIRKRFQP